MEDAAMALATTTGLLPSLLCHHRLPSPAVLREALQAKARRALRRSDAGGLPTVATAERRAEERRRNREDVFDHDVGLSPDLWPRPAKGREDLAGGDENRDPQHALFLSPIPVSHHMSVADRELPSSPAVSQEQPTSTLQALDNPEREATSKFSVLLSSQGREPPPSLSDSPQWQEVDQTVPCSEDESADQSLFQSPEKKRSRHESQEIVVSLSMRICRDAVVPELAWDSPNDQLSLFQHSPPSSSDIVVPEKSSWNSLGNSDVALGSADRVLDSTPERLPIDVVWETPEAASSQDLQLRLFDSFDGVQPAVWMVVIGVSGVTNGGKTTLAKALKRALEWDGHCVHLVSQDDFFRPLEQIEPVPDLSHQNWDIPSAIDFEAFHAALTVLCSQHTDDVLIVEGFLVFHDARIRGLCERRWFLTLGREECGRRRRLRTDYEPPDPPRYFEDIVWPAYLTHLETVRGMEGIRFIDGANPWTHNLRTIAVDTRRLLGQDWVCVSEDALCVEAATQFATEPHTGAVSIFLGTTRDSFEGREVVDLEYEAYPGMARKALGELADGLRRRWPELARVALLHRIGYWIIGGESRGPAWGL